MHLKINKNILVTTIANIVMIFSFYFVKSILTKSEEKVTRILVMCIGDESTPYTENFIRTFEQIQHKMGECIHTDFLYNIREESVNDFYYDVVKKRPDLVIGTSFGYDESLKKWAKMNPSIQFINCTGINANIGDYVENFHNAMGTVYEARYVSGIIAGLKLRELIKTGSITSNQAVIGYIGAFPYAEVISGYTAFFLGVRSIVDNATMKVCYTNSWSNYFEEKRMAKMLIDNGCVIISQHSDTTGPAIACQELNGSYLNSRKVCSFHTGYNASMIDVAPTSTLVSCKINWVPYFTQAIEAVSKGKKIEKYVDAVSTKNDCWAGFDKNWVEILDLNLSILPMNTEKVIEDVLEKLKNGYNVFCGDYTGKDPFDSSNTIDLSKNEFHENSVSSSPKFGYVLDDYIEVLDF